VKGNQSGKRWQLLHKAEASGDLFADSEIFRAGKLHSHIEWRQRNAEEMSTPKCSEKCSDGLNPASRTSSLILCIIHGSQGFSEPTQLLFCNIISRKSQIHFTWP
jgi:hypothetical protein